MALLLGVVVGINQPTGGAREESPGPDRTGDCTYSRYSTSGAVTATYAHTKAYGDMRLSVTHDTSVVANELHYDLESDVPIKATSRVRLYMADGTVKENLKFPSNSERPGGPHARHYWNDVDYPATARKIEFLVNVGPNGRVVSCAVTMTW
jgi:hypothetical protein